MRTDDCILIFRLGRLGDFLVAYPAMRVIRERYRGRRIVLLTGYSSKHSVIEIATTYAGVSQAPWVELFSQEVANDVVWYSGRADPKTWLSLRKRLSMYAFEETFILAYSGETVSRCAKKLLWLRSLGIGGIIHWFPQGGAWARAQSISDQMITPLNSLSQLSMGELRRATAKLHVRSVDAVWADENAGNWSRGKKIVAVSTGATHEHKRWPIERFVGIIRRLIESYNVVVILLGSMDDMNRSVDLQTDTYSGRVLDLCGQTSLGQLAGVLCKCSLWIGNDGGMAHLAAALKVPTVTIMSGVSVQGVWDPSGECNTSVRAGDLDCIGCGCETHCPRAHSKCIWDISVENVYRASRRYLESLYLAGNGT